MILSYKVKYGYIATLMLRSGKQTRNAKLTIQNAWLVKNTLHLMGPCGPKTMCIDLGCKHGSFTMLIRFRSIGSSGVAQPCSIGGRCDIMDSCMLRAQLGAQASTEECLLFWCVVDFCRKVRSPLFFFELCKKLSSWNSSLGVRPFDARPQRIRSFDSTAVCRAICGKK